MKPYFQWWQHHNNSSSAQEVAEIAQVVYTAYELVIS